ncbi:hypothetical protein PG996_000841 [Apiospora saccharicola]|uniref:Zn(2)-C6 fungal-type domain-containing protein n=1 Tax=Apiospora saccharicola TaxID=335842 RepID=A0ABR1WEW3_9PEZI
MTGDLHAGMAALGQLANEAPGFINQVGRRHTPRQVPLNSGNWHQDPLLQHPQLEDFPFDFRDWPSPFEETQDDSYSGRASVPRQTSATPANWHDHDQSRVFSFDISEWIVPSMLDEAQEEEHMEARSNPDAASVPGLTSGSSDEGGASPSSPVEDGAPDKARLKILKQHDDDYTIPQREIRPKNPHYPSRILLNHNLEYTSSPNLVDNYREGSSSGYTLSSAARHVSSSMRSPTIPTQKPGRGKRAGPLHDRENVAEVRERGACLRCRIKKTKCSTQYPCEHCSSHVRKQWRDSMMSEYDLCVRLEKGMALAFPPDFSPAASKFGGKSNPLRWFIYFDTHATLPEALDVCVQEVELGLPAMSHQANSGRSQRCYVFLRDSVPSSQLIEEWAEKQMLKESDSGFLSALDLFTYSCVRGGFHNVPQIWKPRRLYYRDANASQAYPLPASIVCELRGMARAELHRLERDIWTTFDKLSSPGVMQAADQLPTWVSIMLLMLTYKDMHTMERMQNQSRSGSSHRSGSNPGVYQSFGRPVRELFMALVVMCEAHFKRGVPDDIAVADPTNHASQRVGSYWQQLPHESKMIANSLEQFLPSLNREPSSLDTYVKTLFAKMVKGHSRGSKRRKTAS